MNGMYTSHPYQGCGRDAVTPIQGMTATLRLTCSPADYPGIPAQVIDK